VRHERQSRETALIFVRSFDGPLEKYMWAVVPKESENAIGTSTLYHINRNHGSAEIGLLIGERDYWGSGASEEAIGLMADFAFDTLGLHRLTGGSYSKNRGMNFTYRKIGFTLEGRMRQAFRLSLDEYVDGYRWGLLADEWRARRRGRVGG
jgi:[ribosomal protein S5]-alanine N-acetyltransferase